MTMPDGGQEQHQSRCAGDREILNRGVGRTVAEDAEWAVVVPWEVGA
jgi:hypothetical protein